MCLKPFHGTHDADMCIDLPQPLIVNVIVKCKVSIIECIAAPMQDVLATLVPILLPQPRAICDGIACQNGCKQLPQLRRGAEDFSLMHAFIPLIIITQQTMRKACGLECGVHHNFTVHLRRPELFP